MESIRSLFLLVFSAVFKRDVTPLACLWVFIMGGVSVPFGQTSPQEGGEPHTFSGAFSRRPYSGGGRVDPSFFADARKTLHKEQKDTPPHGYTTGWNHQSSQQIDAPRRGLQFGQQTNEPQKNPHPINHDFQVGALRGKGFYGASEDSAPWFLHDSAGIPLQPSGLGLVTEKGPVWISGPGFPTGGIPTREVFMWPSGAALSADGVPVWTSGPGVPAEGIPVGSLGVWVPKTAFPHQDPSVRVQSQDSFTVSASSDALPQTLGPVYFRLMRVFPKDSEASLWRDNPLMPPGFEEKRSAFVRLRRAEESSVVKGSDPLTQNHLEKKGQDLPEAVEEIKKSLGPVLNSSSFQEERVAFVVPSSTDKFNDSGVELYGSGSGLDSSHSLEIQRREGKQKSTFSQSHRDLSGSKTRIGHNDPLREFFDKGMLSRSGHRFLVNPQFNMERWVKNHPTLEATLLKSILNRLSQEGLVKRGTFVRMKKSLLSFVDQENLGSLPQGEDQPFLFMRLLMGLLERKRSESIIASVENVTVPEKKGQ